MINLYFFIWPSNLGGADTRLKELIQCFSQNSKYKLFCIPNDNFRLEETDNVDFLNINNTTILRWEDLPEKTDGFAISFCNFRLFSEEWRLKKIKSIGLKFIWSNDMMWRTPEEEKAFDDKMIDATIYTSNKHFNDIKINKTKEFIIPNYFHLPNYPYIERFEKEDFSIGKHSRPDKFKFSDNFPLFYEGLKLKNPKYRIMGVDVNFLNRFKWFTFDKKKWQLLQPAQKPVIEYLKTLDCYIYNSHYKFTETQCRATIEAMLTGLPVIAPKKENFLNQIWNHKSGFIYNDYEELIDISNSLERSYKDRIQVGKLAREISKNLWCNTEEHTKLWEEIFNTI